MSDPTISAVTPDESPVFLLAFGAHPDDIEFGCGAIVAQETRRGRAAHLVVCSLGEAATHGHPEERRESAVAGARHMGAAVEFIDLDGDAHFRHCTAHVVRLAAIMRRLRPAVVLAPTRVPNQHPDHAVLGALVMDAARLARYGGVHELRGTAPHAIGQLLSYAVTPSAEPLDVTPLLIDVSGEETMRAWQDAMAAHGSQTAARGYVELVVARARTRGLTAGVGHAMALFPTDPPLFDGLDGLARSARAF